MKKIAGKIAMVLIMVMLAGSFTSCLSYVNRDEPTLNRVLYGVVDIIFLPISLIALIVYLIVTQEAGPEGYYLADLDNNLSMEHYSLLQKMNSLPEAERAFIMQALNSIPEAERISTIEKITSLPETQITLLIKAYNSLPESAVISSIEKIKSLPEAEIASLLQTFNSLTETELDSIIESINSQSKSEIENVALTDDFNSLTEIDFVYSFEALETKPVTIASALQY